MENFSDFLEFGEIEISPDILEFLIKIDLENEKPEDSEDGEEVGSKTKDSKKKSRRENKKSKKSGYRNERKSDNYNNEAEDYKDVFNFDFKAEFFEYKIPQEYLKEYKENSEKQDSEKARTESDVFEKMVNQQHEMDGFTNTSSFPGRDANRQEVYFNEGLLKIKYESPVFMENQVVYQSIFIEAKEDTTVYELTTKVLKSNNVQVESRYDRKFDSMLFTSVDNIKDGQEGIWTEFYLNGRIGEDAVDKAKVKKGDIIELRSYRANDESGFCGGGQPDQEKRFGSYGSTLNPAASGFGRNSLSSRSLSSYSRGLGFGYF
jgi:hypothetical protein